MRSVVLYIACSLDGKIARTDGALDWLPGANGEETEDYGFADFMAGIDTCLMGWNTYEKCLEFGDWYYKDQITYVFSRRADRQVAQPECQLSHQDPAELVRQLKEQTGKNIFLVGGGAIIKALHEADLIDEYIITLVPYILGEGIPLFPDLQRSQPLELLSARTLNPGMQMLHYRRKQSL